jgi:DNA-binding response OmpR family regulator
MKPRILLAEIDETVREDWASALERARFEVEQTQSPRESLYRFCIQTPDLMILSLEGPVADGLKTLELMRNFSPTCPLLILANEAEQFVAIAREGKELVLKKPIDGPGLLKAVKTLVKPLAVHPPASPCFGFLPSPVRFPAGPANAPPSRTAGDGQPGPSC